MNKNDIQDDIVTIKIPREPHISVAAKSIIGTRDYQQDAYYVLETANGHLAVLCDGMGGMENGEKASQKAVEKLSEDFGCWDGMNVPDFLLDEAKKMDKLIFELADEKGNKLNAGTTTAAVVVIENKMYWLSVGDSRIYVFRGNEMQCVTRDHNYGFQMEQKLLKGEVSQKEFEEKKGKFEALVSYIGMGGLEMVDVNRMPFELEFGDRVLICSDGLYKCLKEEVFEQIILHKFESAEKTVDCLLQAVEETEKKHKDNTTVMILSYQ